MRENSISFYGDLFIKGRLDFPVLQEDEISVINLEAPVTSSSLRYPGKVNLLMNYQHIQESFNSKNVVFSLGNNHIMDCMEEGYKDTIDFLQSNGYRYFGAGSLESLCGNPIILQVGSKSVALINVVSKFTSPVLAEGNNTGVLDLKYFKDAYAQAKSKNAETVIAIIHWGAEEITAPAPYDVQFAHSLIDIGVDLIVGHHSHCIQTVEKYKGKYIFYGLGNFAFAPLNEQSYFDQSGESTRTYIKQGHFWNYNSLRVKYNPYTEKIELFKLKFDGSGAISQKKVSLKKYARSLPDVGYKVLFKLVFIQNKLMLHFFNFLKEPKLPNRKILQSFIKVFSKKEFK